MRLGRKTAVGEEAVEDALRRLLADLTVEVLRIVFGCEPVVRGAMTILDELERVGEAPARAAARRVTSVRVKAAVLSRVMDMRLSHVWKSGSLMSLSSSKCPSRVTTSRVCSERPARRISCSKTKRCWSRERRLASTSSLPRATLACCRGSLGRDTSYVALRVRLQLRLQELRFTVRGTLLRLDEGVALLLVSEGSARSSQRQSYRVHRVALASWHPGRGTFDGAGRSPAGGRGSAD